MSDDQDLVRGIVFRDSEIRWDGAAVRADIPFHRHTEGWVGIPHGGVGMGALVDLLGVLSDHENRPGPRCPLSVHFRMGGARVRVGMVGAARVVRSETGYEGEIRVGETGLPYLSAAFRYGEGDPAELDTFRAMLPLAMGERNVAPQPLPNYRNCFVCGLERTEPGLMRRFSCLGGTSKTVVARIGFAEEDAKSVHLFRRGDILHPIVLLALLDETMGWAGFLRAAQGGVSVRLDFSLLRDARVGEKILVFGKSERAKGDVRRRLLFWAHGGAAALGSDGSLEPIVVSSGQWLAVPDLTEQMKRELFPGELTRRAFEIAESE